MEKHCHISKVLVEYGPFFWRIDEAKGDEQRLVIKSAASARGGLSCDVTQPLLTKGDVAAKPCTGQGRWTA
jgi:hypothetical protein